MSPKSENRFLSLGSVFMIAVALCWFSGCEINSVQQNATNTNSNLKTNNSEPLNFVAAAQPESNKASLNSLLNNTNNAVNENTNSVINADISQNAESAAIAQAVSVEINRIKKSETFSQFDTAAAQNEILEKNLIWTFGGKTQTGWYLYKPLICHAIGIEIEASGSEFAANLSRWQKANNLPPNGILDAVTLALFVKKWQSNRLKTRGSAAPNELLVAPTADFFDVSRPEELRQVQRDTFVAYKKLIAAAIADKTLNLAGRDRAELAASEKFLKIVSAFRSREYQDKLRRESPNSGRAGLAIGNSPHFTGRALDIYVGGEPVITKDENRAVQVKTKVYLWLVKNAGKYGFKPYFYEPWHWEYAPD